MEKHDELEFKWGKSVGVKNKEIKFYESFTFDGVDYALYDCVYMHKQGEPEPYIGKLVEISELPDKSRRVKVQWFFRPSEIAYYLRDATVLEKELFFASGKGCGLANDNDLEAIAGKCDVICISKDARNPQPSEEIVQLADYVFYRIFDVENCTISDQICDPVGGVAVKFVFNRTESIKSIDVPGDMGNRVEERTDFACKVKDKSAGKHLPHELGNAKTDENSDCMLAKDRVVNSDIIDTRSTLDAKEAGSKVRGEKVKVKDRNSSSSHVHVEEKVKQGTSVRVDASLCRENSKSMHAKDSVCTTKDGKLGENLSAHEGILPFNDVSPNETMGMGLSKTNVLTNKTPKTRSRVDFEGSEQVGKLVKSSGATTEGHLTSTHLSKGKLKLGHDVHLVSKDKTLAKDSCVVEGMPQKKVKLDDSRKILENNKENTTKKLKGRTFVSETKESLLETPYDNEGKPKLGKGALKEYHNEKVHKASYDATPVTTFEDDDTGKVGKIFEVTRRPIVEKRNWMKFTWEERMKKAHGQAKLVLLQNLDPAYTSQEVEDIIWHAFREDCTARMVQHTATSNPHSGKAFVIFETSEATDKVVKKLTDGCLMLPNKRPLVVCTGFSPKEFEKQSTFVGHITIEKARRQNQINREMKDAVSTSHYSQNNTIEYEMAMAWCLLQSRSDRWWTKLYEQQWKELKKLKDDLKSKDH